VTAPLVAVEALRKDYPGPRRWLGLGRPRHVVRAVDDVSFTIEAGETLGLVGEPGGRPSRDYSAGRATAGAAPTRTTLALGMGSRRRCVAAIVRDPHGHLTRG
jgi:ABC-type microcin C transport system duplicated ATPase subunit YejF